MKIALYVEDGLEQIVLTPTSETEKAILEKIHDDTRELSIKRGEFYGCQSGWVRQKKQYPHYSFAGDEPNDESTMIILRLRPVAPAKRDQAMNRLKWIWDWDVTVRIGLYGGIPVLWIDWNQRTPPPWKNRGY
jgi:hypothetical protein